MSVLGHVGINVTDLTRSVAFYTEAFGFDILGQSSDPAFAFLGVDKKPLITLWQQSEGSFDSGRPGLHHLAFQMESRGDVEALGARLADMGAKIYHDGLVAHREGASSGGIYFEDPDGIRLEAYTHRGMEDDAAPSGRAPTCGFF